MPVVRVTIRRGKTPEFKKALLDGVHHALVSAFRIPGHDRRQVLQEADEKHFLIPPERTDNSVLIEMTVFPGRSREAKKQLFRSIVDNLAKAPGIDGDDILIVLYEPPLENWGIRGGKPANEVPLGFSPSV